MKRPNGASEVWWGHVAENQHCDEAWRRARPTADGLTQQLNLLQICEARRVTSASRSLPHAGTFLPHAAVDLARTIQERISNLRGWFTVFKSVGLEAAWNVVLRCRADAAPFNVVF